MVLLQMLSSSIEYGNYRLNLMLCGVDGYLPGFVLVLYKGEGVSKDIHFVHVTSRVQHRSLCRGIHLGTSDCGFLELVQRRRIERSGT